MSRTFVAALDASKCRTIGSFLSEVSSAFKFPDYFGGNYNALWECLTDLEWLGCANYDLVIHNSSLLLVYEPRGERAHLLDLLNKVAANWDGVPNYPGEEQFRDRSEFRVVLE